MIRNILGVSILCLVAILAACSDNAVSENNPEVLKVDIEVSKTSEFLKEIKRIKFIPLETKADVLIGSIQKIKIFNDRVYILDIFSAKSVFIYDFNGKHVKTICSVGKGPAEYVRLWDIAIDPFNKELITVDVGSKKIHKYDLNGVFKEEQKLGFTPYSIGIADKNTYAFKTVNQRDPVIVTTNHLGQKIKEVHSGVFEFNMNLFCHFPRSNDGRQLYLEYLNDTIYEIGKDYSEPWLIIDFQNLAITPKKQEELKKWSNMRRTMPSVPKNYAGAVGPLLESESFINFYCEHDEGMSSVLWDKHTQKHICIHKLRRGDDMMTRLLFYLLTVKDADSFVGKISSYEMSELFDNKYFKSLQEQGKIEFEESGFANQREVTLESNPVLFTIEYNRL